MKSIYSDATSFCITFSLCSDVKLNEIRDVIAGVKSIDIELHPDAIRSGPASTCCFSNDGLIHLLLVLVVLSCLFHIKCEIN